MLKVTDVDGDEFFFPLHLVESVVAQATHNLTKDRKELKVGVTFKEGSSTVLTMELDETEYAKLQEELMKDDDEF